MTPELFYGGLPWDDYAASMQVNHELLRRKCREFTLPNAERERWQNSAIAHVLVFTEDWCQDSISALPPLLALHAVASFDLRVLRRSEALELQRALTGQPFPPVPMFVFYDAEWQEWGRFIEMPRAFRRLKEEPAEAMWLKEMYDEMWWETELAELANIVESDGEHDDSSV